MEQKFGINSIDIEALREFCEREGAPARWFGLNWKGIINDPRVERYK